MRHYSTWLMLALLALTTSCDQERLVQSWTYDVTVFDEEAAVFATGVLVLDFDLDKDSGITGSWEWSRELFDGHDSGELTGSVSKEGQIEVSFDLWKYATDIGYGLTGAFVGENEEDFEGEVFIITIAGVQHNGHSFEARRR